MLLFLKKTTSSRAVRQNEHNETYVPKGICEQKVLPNEFRTPDIN